LDTSEPFYARLLLTRKPATSFEDLRSVYPLQDNGEPDETKPPIIHETFEDAARAMGLLIGTNEYEIAFSEAMTVLTPAALRAFFVTLFVAGAKIDEMWQRNEEFKRRLSADFVNEANPYIEAVLAIGDILGKSGKTLSGVMANTVKELGIECSCDVLLKSMRKSFYGASAEEAEKVYRESIEPREEQKRVYDAVRAHIDDYRSGKPLSEVRNGRVVSVIGPGGAGKSFIAKALLYYARSQKSIAIACGPTGVSALNFEGSFTIHTLFKIKVPDSPTEEMEVRANGVAESSLEEGSEMWSLLEHLSFLVIDEISMAVISIMRKVHEKLCEIKGCPEDIPFAGIPILMMGDARQLAPVVSQATPSDVYFESIFNWDGFKNSQVFLMTNSVRQEGNSEFGKWVQDVGIGSAPIDELAPRAKPGSAKSERPLDYK